MVGAGYDGRALRFRSPGVRFFELDRPVTQADKRARLAALGDIHSRIVFVPVDFTTQNAADALEAAGHDSSQKSLFLCEGVLLYLDEPVIVRLLSELCGRAAAGSVLAVNIPVRVTRSEGLHLRRRVLDVVLWLAGEPPRTQLTRDDALELPRRAGWVPRRVVDPADLNPRARSGHVLLVEATPGTGADGGGSPGADRDTVVVPEEPGTKPR
jgi:methyltransferase (TIGR00027 family)